VAIAFAGQLLVALVTARLARDLGLAEFEAYAVAAAAFLLLSSTASLGADRLALRVMPPLVERGDWASARGYLGFALGRAAAGTSVAVALALLWAFGAEQGGERALLVMTAVLPLGVLARLGLEVVTAAGSAVFAAMALRLAVPVAVLGVLVALPAFGAPPTGATAIAAWGAGAAVACLALLFKLRADTPAEAWRAAPVGEACWAGAATPFWLYRLAVGLIAQSGIIALDRLGAPPDAVGAYAASLTLVAPLLVVSTATSRAYSRDVAILLDRGDAVGLADLIRRRIRWLGPCLIAATLGVFMFTRPLLSLFRPEFVEAGLWPIRILTLTAAFTMTFALAPTILKYRGRNASVLRIVGAAAGGQIALLALFVPPFGATGAAMAAFVTGLATYGRFAVLARAETRALRSGDGAIRRGS
jgi:O-antigen/teichoic acid export membrane protein